MVIRFIPFMSRGKNLHNGKEIWRRSEALFPPRISLKRKLKLMMIEAGIWTKTNPRITVFCLEKITL